MTTIVDGDKEIRRRWSVSVSDRNLGRVTQDEEPPADVCGFPGCETRTKKSRRTCCIEHSRGLSRLEREQRYAEMLEDYDFLCDTRARVWEIPERLGFESPQQLANWLTKRGRSKEAGVFERIKVKESVSWWDLPEFMRRPRGTLWS